jgi:hypothetical protein
MNQEIYNRFKSPDTVTVINVCRLEWLGYILRIDGERTVKKLLEGKLGGGEKRIPRLRWLDDVELDLGNMGLKRYTTIALDRTD